MIMCMTKMPRVKLVLKSRKPLTFFLGESKKELLKDYNFEIVREKTGVISQHIEILTIFDRRINEEAIIVIDRKTQTIIAFIAQHESHYFLIYELLFRYDVELLDAQLLV